MSVPFKPNPEVVYIPDLRPKPDPVRPDHHDCLPANSGKPLAELTKALHRTNELLSLLLSKL